VYEIKYYEIFKYYYILKMKCKDGRLLVRFVKIVKEVMSNLKENAYKVYHVKNWKIMKLLVVGHEP